MSSSRVIKCVFECMCVCLCVGRERVHKQKNSHRKTKIVPHEILFFSAGFLKVISKKKKTLFFFSFMFKNRTSGTIHYTSVWLCAGGEGGEERRGGCPVKW